MNVNATIDATDPLAAATMWLDAMRQPTQWLTDMVALQSAGWSALYALNSDWLARAAAAGSDLPSWFVWHNGTEQLG